MRLARPPALVVLIACAPFGVAFACHAVSRPEPDTALRAQLHAPRTAPFDVLHYALALELLPAERAVRAECRVRIAGLPLQEAQAELTLDLVGLEVTGVSDEHGRSLRFQQAAGELRMALAEALEPGGETELAIRYGGRPERGLWFSGERHGRPTQVFTHGETEGSRGWFPCFDEPSERATSELSVTLPNAWVAVAAGERVSSQLLPAGRCEHWRMDFPHPAYLTTLVAGELVLREDRTGPVPLAFLSPESCAAWLEPTFAETGSILAFLADYTGVAYPYPKYSQAAVDNFPWGGMENISATTLTPLILTDELGRPDVRPTQLIAHEAAHQWFGNLVTCADWSQLWLNEGFASYFALLYLGATRGEEAFRCELLAAQEAYLNEDVGAARRATIERVWKEPDDVFDTRPYQGAAARLHLLRHEVGEEAFRAGIRAYLGEHRGRSVVTADFRRAVEHAAGCDLGAFFEQWFARAGFPEFALAWEWDPERGLARLEVEQTQPSAARTPEVFELALDVEFGLEPARVVRIEIDERAEHFEFPLPARPAYVVFDRGGFVPKRVQEEKELAEWLAVAQRCSDSGARRDAVKALGRWAGATRAEVAERARDELAVRLSADPAPHVRVAAATALGGLAQAEEALRRAVLGDPDVRVQAATLGALGALGADDGRASLAEDVFVTGASYAVRAAAAGLFCRADPARAFEFVKRALELDSPHDALAGGLLRVLATLPDARVADALRAFAADAARAPTARAVAVEQLGALTRERAQNARFLEGFLTEPSFHLRQATVAALVALGDAGARSALTAYYPRSRTALERRWIESFLERSEP